MSTILSGRQLHNAIKDHPSTSLCAFCAHRLATSRPLRLQRKFLHSTQSNSRLSVEATGLRSEDENFQTRPPPQSEANHGSTISTQDGDIPRRSQASIANFELPHERRLKEMMAKVGNAQPTSTIGRSAEAPQATAPPFSRRARDEASREQAVAKARNGYRGNYMPSLNDSTGRYAPQRSHKIMGDGADSYSFTSPSFQEGNTNQWPQLRKHFPRGREAAQSTPPPNPYVAERDRREQEARKGTYTPLASQATLDRVSVSRLGSTRSRMVDRPEDAHQSYASSQRRLNLSSEWFGGSTGSESQASTRAEISPVTPSRSEIAPGIPLRMPERSTFPSTASQASSTSLADPQRRRTLQATSQPNRTSGQDFIATKSSNRRTPEISGPLDNLWTGLAPRTQTIASKESRWNSESRDLGDHRGRQRQEGYASFRPLFAKGPPQEKTSFESPYEGVQETPKASEQFAEITEDKRDKSDGKRRQKNRFVDADGDEDLEDVPREKVKSKGKNRRKESDDVEHDDDQDIESIEQRAAKRAERKKQRKLEKLAKKANTPAKILLPEYISVANLAVALKVRVEDFQIKLTDLGFEGLSNDHILNAETSGLIAMEYDFEPIIDRGESLDLKASAPPENISELPPRPPVVTIMGHVDHGKTTILDWLRKSSIAAGEHGGITQHIGAFSVPMPSGKIITFLDTPGHAAFLDMRQRGANVTDIVILVVAADDSVKPQTIEAISHAKAAKVPMIVAINKVDKEDIDIDRVKQDLARHEVDIEDYGGDTQVVCISGKTGKGMPDLENAAVTLSEVLDMRADVDGQAEGWVLEASIKSMGKVATVLVRRGTIRPGDFIVAGKTWARVRCMRNEAGVEIEAAGPGTPVEIDGWRSQPEAGDEVLQAPDESKAKSVVDYRLESEERDKMALDMEAINSSRSAIQERRQREKERLEAEAKAAEDAILDAVEAMSPAVTEEDSKPHTHALSLIVKADVSGSLEAVINSVVSLGNAEVYPRIIRSGVGQISEFDVTHASSAKGHIINFNTEVDSNIRRMADDAKVRIMDHNIIYRLVDDVKKELVELLPPSVTHRVLGEVEILKVFQITIKGRKQRPVAGCKVKNGGVGRKMSVRVLRKGERVFDGTFRIYDVLASAPSRVVTSCILS